MDACEIRAPGAVLLRKSELPAEKNYANGHTDAAVKRRVAAMPAAAPTTPRRHPSPNAGRASSPTPAGSQAKRSPSTERRPATPSRLSSGSSRPTTPSRISAPTSPSSAPSSPSSSSSSSSTPVRDAVSETQSAPRRLSGGRAPDGLWPSMRSLSSTFQLESKGKRITSSSSADQVKMRDAAPADRKRSPLRGRTTPEQSENPHAKVIDHHRWPAMMGGRVSASAMSKSMDLTDKISRSALPSVPSRGVSPKRTTMSSAANALSRSIDLADKIDRLVSSSVSSRGGSPRRSPASSGANDVPKSIGVGKDLKPASLGISLRRASPIRKAASDGTRNLSESMDLTENDNSTLSSSVSSPSISPSASVSSVSNAASQTTTKSSERLMDPFPTCLHQEDFHLEELLLVALVLCRKVLISLGHQGGEASVGFRGRGEREGEEGGDVRTGRGPRGGASGGGRAPPCPRRGPPPPPWLREPRDRRTGSCCLGGGGVGGVGVEFRIGAAAAPPVEASGIRGAAGRFCRRIRVAGGRFCWRTAVGWGTRESLAGRLARGSGKPKIVRAHPIRARRRRPEAGPAARFGAVASRRSTRSCRR